MSAATGTTVVKLVPQPENIDVTLFPHQRANIFQMERLEREKSTILPDGNCLEGNIGILGDPPGTGKTYTVLGLICRDKMKWEGPAVDLTLQACSNIDGSLRITRKETLMRIDTTLIVTPLSIFHQWESEIKHTKLSYKMIKNRAEITDVEQYDVVVCTVNMYNDLVVKYRDFCFKRFIYDEMDSAYIANMETVRAGFLWFVSATFSEVLREINRSRKMHYMKRLFMNILSDFYSQEMLLNSITVRSTQKLRDLRPAPVEYRSVYYDIDHAPVVRHLGDQMDHELTEAIRHLGGTEEDSNVADVMRRRAHNKVREAEMKVGEYVGRQQEEWRGRLDDARRALSRIEERIEAIQLDDCPLCSVTMRSPTLMGCCQNVACGHCVATWIRMNHSCPFCRNTSPALVHLNHHDQPSPSEEKKEIQPPARGDKFSHLVHIATTSRKVLVFAAHSTQFGEISATLRARNITYSLVSGSVSQRQAALDAYIRGPTKVLILNSRMNGAGLNLQATTDIVLWHSMPTPLTRQIIGRALRYGIDHPLVVHKFFRQEEDGQVAQPEERRQTHAAPAPPAHVQDDNVNCAAH
jgi:hypothetical protein